MSSEKRSRQDPSECGYPLEHALQFCHYPCLSDSGASAEDGEAVKISAFIGKADTLLYLEVKVEMETFPGLDAAEPC